MTVTVFIKAKVRDFEEWKSMFDDLEHQRQQAEIKFNAYRNAEHPETSYVIGTAPSREIFFKFFTSPERQAIQASVITSPPEITFLEKC